MLLCWSKLYLKKRMSVIFLKVIRLDNQSEYLSSFNFSNSIFLSICDVSNLEFFQHQVLPTLPPVFLTLFTSKKFMEEEDPELPAFISFTI